MLHDFDLPTKCCSSPRIVMDGIEMSFQKRYMDTFQFPDELVNSLPRKRASNRDDRLVINDKNIRLALNMLTDEGLSYQEYSDLQRSLSSSYDWILFLLEVFPPTVRSILNFVK